MPVTSRLKGPSVITGSPEQLLVEKWGTWVMGTWSGVAEERVGGGDQKGDKDQRVKGQRVRQWGRYGGEHILCRLPEMPGVRQATVSLWQFL